MRDNWTWARTMWSGTAFSRRKYRICSGAVRGFLAKNGHVPSDSLLFERRMNAMMAMASTTMNRTARIHFSGQIASNELPPNELQLMTDHHHRSPEQSTYRRMTRPHFPSRDYDSLESASRRGDCGEVLAVEEVCNEMASCNCSEV